MDLTGRIRAAHQAVHEARLPDDLRAIAFTEVLRHLLGTGGPVVDGAPAQPAVEVFDEYASQPLFTSRAARLAWRLEIDEEALADVLDIEDDVVTYHVLSSRISTARSRATVELAMLVTVVRQGSGLDDSWTHAIHVRELLQRYNRYDPSNFAANLKAAGDLFTVRGRPPALEIRLTQAGWEAATDHVRSLAHPSRW